MCSAIAIVRGDNEIARTNQLQHKRYGGHSSTGDDTAHSSLELGQCLRQVIAGWISGAGVIVGSLFSEPVERKRRREMDWRHHCTVVQVGCDPGPYCARHSVLRALSSFARLAHAISLRSTLS